MFESSSLRKFVRRLQLPIALFLAFNLIITISRDTIASTSKHIQVYLPLLSACNISFLNPERIPTETECYDLDPSNNFFSMATISGAAFVLYYDEQTSITHEIYLGEPTYINRNPDEGYSFELLSHIHILSFGPGEGDFNNQFFYGLRQPIRDVNMEPITPETGFDRFIYEVAAMNATYIPEDTQQLINEIITSKITSP
jgi:hypothetical protein